MLSRWAPELLEGEKEPASLPDPLDVYLDGTLPGTDEEPEPNEAVYESVKGTSAPYSQWGIGDWEEDEVFTPAVDHADSGTQAGGWATEEEDPLGEALGLDPDVSPEVEAEDDNMDG